MLIQNEEEMLSHGQSLGAQLKGGEVIELVGDVGTGKTTLTKGIARGLEVEEEIQSPSFTISRTYAARDGLTLNHYDFYRLTDPGIIKNEIAESSQDPKNITIVEWGEQIADVLPPTKITIKISYAPQENARTLDTE